MEELGLYSFVNIRSLKRNLYGFISVCFAVPFRQQRYARLTNPGRCGGDYRWMDLCDVPYVHDFLYCVQVVEF
ncbi:hypothetical protein [Bifidobacterium sp.]